jgi:hypothetical protein
LAGVAAISAFAIAAPVASAALPDAGAVAASAGSAVGSVQQQATATVAATQQVTAQAEQTVSKAQPPAPRVQAPTPPAPKPPAPEPRSLPQAPSLPERPAIAAPSVDIPPAPDVAREVGEVRDKAAQPVRDLRGVKPVDDAMTLLGDTLRRVAPLGSLLAPIAPLLGGPGAIDELPDLVAIVSPHEAAAPVDAAQKPPPTGAVLGAAAHPRAPAAGGPPAASAPAHTFQAASARPPAAEVGGRPVSSPPWTAPAPVAGGATALPFSSSSAGGFFVPFLALLVLAALAVPRLMRRLDGLPAFVRPEPFLCALERPG